MLYIEVLDKYSVRFGNGVGGGTHSKVYPKTLQARCDERDNIWNPLKELIQIGERFFLTDFNHLFCERSRNTEEHHQHFHRGCIDVQLRDRGENSENISQSNARNPLFFRFFGLLAIEQFWRDSPHEE